MKVTPIYACHPGSDPYVAEYAAVFMHGGKARTVVGGFLDRAEAMAAGFERQAAMIDKDHRLAEIEAKRILNSITQQ